MKLFQDVQRLFVILVVCGFCAQGVHAKSTDEARQMIQNMGDQAIQELLSAHHPLKKRQEIVRRFLRESFDLPSIARFTMGTYWRSMNADQKNRLNSIFEETIVSVYTQRFEGYETAQFTVLEATHEGKGIRVSTQILMPGRPPLKVDWKVFSTPHGLKILDVLIEGISMSITQKSEFSGLIQQNGGSIDRFIEILHQRVQP